MASIVAEAVLAQREPAIEVEVVQPTTTTTTAPKERTMRKSKLDEMTDDQVREALNKYGGHSLAFKALKVGRRAFLARLEKMGIGAERKRATRAPTPFRATAEMSDEPRASAPQMESAEEWLGARMQWHRTELAKLERALAALRS